MCSGMNRPIDTAAALAEWLGGEVVGRADLPIRGLNALADAGPDEVTFIADDKHAARWGASRAGAAVVTRSLEVAGHDPANRALILVPNAELAMARLLERFSTPPWKPEPGVHPTAVIDPGARIDPAAFIGPHVTIGPGATIGRAAVLHAGVWLGAGAAVGEESVLYPNVVVRDRCRVGANCILHSGVAIGTDGFGYRPSEDKRTLVKIPHVGDVIIEDGVEIGANSCVDRGKFGSTIIGSGTKIDNLVQVGHNCRIGRCCVIAAQVALAGSVTIEDGAQLGGGSGVAEHVRIGRGARLAGYAGVISDVAPGETVFGIPAQPHREALKQVALVRRLRVWMDQVETRLDDLEE